MQFPKSIYAEISLRAHIKFICLKVKEFIEWGWIPDNHKPLPKIEYLKLSLTCKITQSKLTVWSYPIGFSVTIKATFPVQGLIMYGCFFFLGVPSLCDIGSGWIFMRVQFLYP